ncbi:hypothetical protein M501DRAFT_925770 [Patellaria atrata CBS 101060]|uniref:Uncharacterized protein n=1 Tax=Patellaria atrata CBS 101060 TaxID=1346257 RepID=A0A9P4SK82_9PEZI|nr:hypothetical protein M501DRAFT_925770 [Patellaria atrata CBS 101060]
MFAQPKPAPIPAKKAAEAPQVPDVGLPPPSEDITAPEEQVEAAIETEALSIPPVADEAAPDEPIAETTEPSISTPDITEDTAALDLTPSKDELTVDNVEHLPDSSHPVVSETVASTVASTRDAGSTLSAITPSIPLQQQPPIGRPPMGGYATTAYKATATPGTRSASYQRRLLEQQEAVVLPGNHAIDKVGVQFGSMGLNGDLDSDTLDVDEDREEAETRTQPPQHSPTQQPRASLPPVPRQPSAPTEAPQPETLPTPKAAPGLPSVPQQHPPPQQAAQSSPPAPLGSQVMSQQGSQGAHPYSQFGRYGQPNPTDASAPSQKPYDPFGHQAAQSNQFEGFPGQSSAQSQQPQNHSQQGAFSSAPSDYSSYYTSEQQRNAYSNYYGHNYNQQGASGQNDSAPSQQRVGSAFSAAPGDSSYPTSQPQQSQSRYSEAQNSGHTTPNPLVGGQTQTGAQSQQAQHIGQQPHGHNSGQHFGGYGAQPYFNNPQQYYNAYMNQYGYGQGGYGGGPFGAGKGGIYGQPHQYGMSPHAGYDQHSSSPANAAAFTQSSLHGRDSALGGALGDYGRSGSAQPSQSQQHGTASGFGGMHDVFGSRGQGGFPSQSQGYGQQQSGQQSGNEDSLKPFGDTKATAGPSPSLGQPHRPSSATNTAPGQGAQSGLPPQSHQQGFGGYPGGLHNNQGSQYGGLGGLGHQGGSQGQGYGGGYGGFGGTYGSYGSRGGWGSNYPNH